MRWIYILVLASCGDGELFEGVFKPEEKPGYPEPCEQEIPDNIAVQLAHLDAINDAAKAAAVNAEQIRLGVRQLKASQILGEATLAETTIKPADDPFPAAIVVVGNLDHDIRQSGYEVTHGMMNQENIYETAPGSGQYFIIDYVLGDGLGAKQAETGSSSDNSWHSWHASNSNVLIRAKQVPVDVVSSEVAICGCGPQKELQLGKIAADESVSSVKYPVAIFMLPAAALPRYSGDEFKASFDRAKINIRYIPRQGFRCAQVPGPVVC